jgi:hypothetical protein
MNYLLVREKSSTGSQSEFGFISKGALRKTVGCPQKPEAQ